MISITGRNLCSFREFICAQEFFKVSFVYAGEFVNAERLLTQTGIAWVSSERARALAGACVMGTNIQIRNPWNRKRKRSNCADSRSCKVLSLSGSIASPRKIIFFVKKRGEGQLSLKLRFLICNRSPSRSWCGLVEFNSGLGERSEKNYIYFCHFITRLTTTSFKDCAWLF